MVEDKNEDDDVEDLVKVLQDVLNDLEELNREVRDLLSPLSRGHQHPTAPRGPTY